MSQAQLFPVPFHDDTIFCTTIDGQPFAPVKPIIENMGLAWQPQAAKLKANEDRWGITIIVIPSESGTQETTCMPVRKLPAFLASINPKKVRPELRLKIELYQNECDDALWAYWTEGQAVRKPKIIALPSTPEPTVPLPPLTCKGLPVVTTEMLAKAYCCTKSFISSNYSLNRKSFVEGKHFFRLAGEELRKFRLQPATYHAQALSPKASSFVLWTAHGAALHAKLVNSEHALNTFKQMEETFFGAAPSKVSRGLTALFPEQGAVTNEIDGVSRVSSVAVAKAWGLRHDKVLTKIRDAIGTLPQDFSSAAFLPGDYYASSGLRPMFHLSHKGFMLILARSRSARILDWARDRSALLQIDKNTLFQNLPLPAWQSLKASPLTLPTVVPALPDLPKTQALLKDLQLAADVLKQQPDDSSYVDIRCELGAVARPSEHWPVSLHVSTAWHAIGLARASLLAAVAMGERG